MQQGHILKVSNLSVKLDSVMILSGISFNVKRGEILAVIGPNGAGKTVLFRALLGLVPHIGSIEWAEKIKIGYVPQRFSIDKGTPLTVQEFLMLKSRNFWLVQPEFLKHLKHELSLVGLDESILKKSLTSLSAGQMQRVLVSYAMLSHPDILLFDEPTTGIDIGAEETIYNLVQKMQKERGIAVILISHDLNVVYRYAKNVLCINKEMLCHGAPQEVLKPEELIKLYGQGAHYRHDHSCEHNK